MSQFLENLCKLDNKDRNNNLVNRPGRPTRKILHNVQKVNRHVTYKIDRKYYVDIYCDNNHIIRYEESSCYEHVILKYMSIKENRLSRFIPRQLYKYYIKNKNNKYVKHEQK
jgi:hypothetical protein